MSDFDLVAGRLGDIEDLGQLASALAGHDGLVHLARVPSNSANPVVFRSNVMGTFNALEAAGLTGAERVVVASSVSVLSPYLALAQRPAYLPLDENPPLAPTHTYPLAKSLVEQMCAAYTREHGMLTAALRPTLVFGPQEYETKARAFLVPGGRSGGLRAYVDSRDGARLCVLCFECLPLGEHRVYCVGAKDALSRDPLAEASPQDHPDVPWVAELAAPLTGTTPAVAIRRAWEEVGYEPRYSWRDELPGLA